MLSQRFTESLKANPRPTRENIKPSRIAVWHRVESVNAIIVPKIDGLVPIMYMIYAEAMKFSCLGFLLRKW